MEAKLKKLRDGVILVKPEEKKLIEQTFSEKMNHWRKRKRIFKDLWDAITENSPKDAKEFKVYYLWHHPLFISLDFTNSATIDDRRSSALNMMKMLEFSCNPIVN